MVVENITNFFSRIFFFSNFVQTAQGFPKPLSPEEEKAEIEKMKKGDVKAREKLITHNLRLVAHIVKSYANSLEADDLLSVGTIGLIKAIDSYNPEKKCQLSTYAARCIHNEILMLLRANKKHKNVVSLNALLDPTDENSNELKDVLSTTGDEIYGDVENKILVQRVKQVIRDKLTDREQQIVKMRYGIDYDKSMTQQDVANVLGISRSYVSRIETKALKLVKDDFESHETILNKKNASVKERKI